MKKKSSIKYKRKLLVTNYQLNHHRDPFSLRKISPLMINSGKKLGKLSTKRFQSEKQIKSKSSSHKESSLILQPETHMLSNLQSQRQKIPRPALMEM